MPALLGSYLLGPGHLISGYITEENNISYPSNNELPNVPKGGIEPIIHSPIGEKIFTGPVLFRPQTVVSS